MTDQEPLPCDQEVFQKGTPLLVADTSSCRASGFEEWVKLVALQSGQKVDWHYSGGIAQVLFLGDRSKVIEAARSIPCPASIMKWFGENAQGLYRRGVTPTPPNAPGAFWEGGNRSTFIVKDEGEKEN